MHGPIFDPRAAGRPLRVAAFLSGGGSNVEKLLAARDGSFEVVFLFSDRLDGACRGPEIARQHGLPFFGHDIRGFHARRGAPRRVDDPAGLAARREFDQVAAKLLAAFQVDLIALGGYMSFLTLGGGVNVHPADLSLVDGAGRRRFTGDHAVRDAILAGERELRASTLWIDQGEDSGPLLLVSDPLPVELPAPPARLAADPAALARVAAGHQARLKEAGDWVIFPLTVRLIAAGRLGLTAGGVVTLDGVPRPAGVRPGEV